MRTTLERLADRLDEDADLMERIGGRMAHSAMVRDPRQQLQFAVSKHHALKANADRLEARALRRDARQMPR